MIHEGDTGSDIPQNLVDEDVTASYDAFYDLLLPAEPRARVPPRRLPARRGDERAVGARRPARPGDQAREHIRHPRGHRPARRARRDLRGRRASRSRSCRPPPPSRPRTTGCRPRPRPSRASCSRRRTRSIRAPTRTTRSRRSSTASSRRSTAPGVPGRPALEDASCLASIVQREAGSNLDDFPKVARVFQNRLDQGMNLESDATVAYGTGNTAHRVDHRRRARGRVEPVQHLRAPRPADRTDRQPRATSRSTRRCTPPTARGCSSCPSTSTTGETVFSTTVEEHEAAVAQLQDGARRARRTPAYG